MKINDLVKTTIVNIKPYGLFLKTEDNEIGLLHISEITKKYIHNIYERYKIGDSLLVKVISIDKNKNKVSFTLKDLLASDIIEYEGLINSSSKLLKNIHRWVSTDNRGENMKLNLEYLKENIDLNLYKDNVASINQMINKKTGLGSDFLGWTTWPEDYNKDEVKRILAKAKYIRNNFEVLVVCGIGGSYLGARAAIEALNGLKSKDSLEIIFMGQTFSSDYIYDTLEYLKDKKFAINVVSKSGTTTETSVAFRLLKDLLEKNIGKERAKDAIIATTDQKSGALKKLCDIEGYETYVLPDNIGGRYSVLTPVGLFPIACANIDILAMLDGAKEAMIKFDNDDLYTNDAYKYAVLRDHLYRIGKSVEMFITYEPRLVQLNEWLKQLFGESEGKDHKGLLPDSAHFSTDLHSLGQFIQEGSPILFETVLYIKNSNNEIKVPSDKDDLDGLNYLSGKTLNEINYKAFLGTLDAHSNSGNVNNIVLEVEKLNSYTLGYLFYFFMRVCAMSAYLLEVNPFNQPGVEVYKKNMFHLLGKKGY